MLENDVSSVKFKGVAQVVRSMKKHYEIVDREQFAYSVYDILNTTYKAGHSLADVFVPQFRISKEVLESLQESDTAPKDLNAMGVSLVEKPELSIRKA